MSLKKYEETDVANIAKTIRSKTGTDTTYNISEMAGGVEEVFEAGRNDILDNSKYIPKTATGKVISLTDVSEVAHKVKVYGDNQEVEVYGKNLFDISSDTRFTKQDDGSYVNNLTLLNDKTSFVLPYNTYVVSYDISCPVGKNARVEFTLGDGTTVSTYTPSTGDFVHIEKIITGKIVNWYFGYSSRPLEGELIMRNVQIEVGSIATTYEPYTHQTITATPTGAEIDSMCPNMNFIADEDITVDYYSSFGMQTEYDRFWDAYQNNGNRTDYGSAFQSWGDAIFKPKYDIIAVGSSGSLFLKSQILDIRKSLENCGVILDTSRATGLSYLVHNSTTKSLPKIDISLCAGSSSLHSSFYNATKLEIIEELVSSENTQFMTNTFQNTPKQTHVIFSGVIASDINLQWSPLLDEESIISLIMSLKVRQFDGNEPTITLHPDVWARAEQLYCEPIEGVVVKLIDEYFVTIGWLRA